MKYAFYFLPQMQDEANDVINTYLKNNNHCTRRQAIKQISKKGQGHTLAKLLDEHNYAKYTMKLSPILLISDLQIDLPLDGLAKIKPLRDLSKKRVTAKVRESLRSILDRKRLSVGCKARWEKGRWIGKGFYNGEKFNWIVINGFPQNRYFLNRLSKKVEI
jgi:hypothetical protein